MAHDFIFDNEMLVQAVYFGFRLGELSCPTRYFKEASSINFRRSLKYGFGVLATVMKYVVSRFGIKRFDILNHRGRRLSVVENKMP